MLGDSERWISPTFPLTAAVLSSITHPANQRAMGPSEKEGDVLTLFFGRVLLDRSPVFQHVLSSFEIP